MEFLIAFTATFIIVIIISIGIRQTKKNNFNHLPANTKPKATTKQQKLKQADEELITVIHPTINHIRNK